MQREELLGVAGGVAGSIEVTTLMPNQAGLALVSSGIQGDVAPVSAARRLCIDSKIKSGSGTAWDVLFLSFRWPKEATVTPVASNTAGRSGPAVCGVLIERGKEPWEVGILA